MSPCYAITINILNYKLNFLCLTIWRFVVGPFLMVCIPRLPSFYKLNSYNLNIIIILDRDFRSNKYCATIFLMQSDVFSLTAVGFPVYRAHYIQCFWKVSTSVRVDNPCTLINIIISVVSIFFRVFSLFFCFGSGGGHTLADAK